jgi:hypothetical protein
LEKIVTIFASDDARLGREFMLWRTEQRAIGEKMICSQNGSPSCIGFATFTEERRTASLQRWLGPLENDLATVAHAPGQRLRRVQHELVHLLRLLDPDGTRFDHKKLDDA